MPNTFRVLDPNASFYYLIFLISVFTSSLIFFRFLYFSERGIYSQGGKECFERSIIIWGI